MPPKKAATAVEADAALAAETDIEGLDPKDVLEDEILAEFAGEPSPAEEDEPADGTDADASESEEGEPEPEAKAEEPKEVAEPAAAEGEPIEAVEAEPKVEEPAPGPAAPPAEVAPVQQPEPAEPVAPMAPVLTAEQVQEAYATQREDAIALLAKEQYALAPETVEALTETLGEDFVKDIPRMLSRVFVDAVGSSMQRTLQILPQAIASVMESRTQSDKSEVAFYTKWPGLREHHPKVVQFAQAYRAVNPAASEDDFIQDVGAQVSVAMRIPIEGAAPAAVVPAALAAARPFVPGKGGATKPAAQPGTGNQFELLAEEIIEEDKVA